MVDTSVEPALGYVQIVLKRDATTLLPIIQQHVASGTVVPSDEWAAYNHMASLPNVSNHDIVTHSSGVHIQNVKLENSKGCVMSTSWQASLCIGRGIRGGYRVLDRV